MQTVTTIEAVRAQVSAWRAAGLRIGFVPTMGNLHAGHASLLAAARARSERVVASVFVNPLQFGPNEDFARYPRTPVEDERLLGEIRCDLLFMPSVEEIFPGGGTQATLVRVRGLSDILCGQFRPGHFDGVATVVAKLFGIVAPDAAVFGEKDYQQFMVIRRMALDLALPVEVVGAATVRADDGLALSSRNRYLTVEERARAPAIHQALQAAVRALAAGDRNFAELERAGLLGLERAGMRPDYFTILSAQDLSPPGADATELVVLTAARLGHSRLIDNLRVKVR
ncbi:MAG TPA: pantoate--beta-alanine ligase [Steroidobacteraceae bacterium]